MSKSIVCGIAVVVAGAALSATGASPLGPAATATAAQVASAGSAGTSPEAASSGSRLWIARYNGPPGTDNDVTSMAVSPDGTRMFVTGYSAKAGTGPGGEFATVGYKTATGARLWARRYHGSGSSRSEAMSVAVSPDGKTVFVTGIIKMEGVDEDYATIAYRAATGTVRWVARYDGPGENSDDGAYSVAASPDGKTVFVTGGSGTGYATIAYRAGTGTRRWVARYRGGGRAVAVAVSPGGGKVIVTGTDGNDYRTVAYRAGSGTQLWARHHDGPSGFREYGGATALAFSPGGGMVFVTGDEHSPGTPSDTGYATIAYRAADGTQLWAASDSPLKSTGGASSVAVSPDGRTVFVTGHDTVAYRAGTGAQLWASPSLDGGYASALAVSPDGRKVFVTGPAAEPASGNNMRAVFTAVAFGAASGARLWVNRYRGPSNLGGSGHVVAVSPGGRRVFVAGYTTWLIPHRPATRYTVIAYRS